MPLSAERMPLSASIVDKRKTFSTSANVVLAGGLGVVGGLSFAPAALRLLIRDLKSKIQPGAPFGVDLLLPQVGGSARKTNHDYTKGQLAELIDVVVDEGAKLFVCAVGVPPKWAVDKL
jgi:NAD(P)H-dependent flavin oxidoreductase YrpB (nitropropane dioxygenase family)